MTHSRDGAPHDGSLDTAWDAIVLGAGPAGAMAARQLAFAGRRVLLVEKCQFPRWKVCGACLNGHALAVLRSAGLGSLTTRLGAVGLNEFRVGFRGRRVCVAMPEGVSLSRSRLDAALVEAAIAAGARFLDETCAQVAEIRDGTRLVRLTNQGRTTEVAGRVVVVATGLANSRFAAGSSPRTRIRPGSRIGAGCLVREFPEYYGTATIFMGIGRSGYVGAVRIEDGSLNVAAAFEHALVRRWGSPGLAAAAILAEAGFPRIDALENAHWQGTAGLTRTTRPLAEERLFLLGDAAGYVEPFTGEGIGWALAAGQAVAPLALQAAERWERGIARSWSELHRRLIGRRQVVCRAVALGLRQPLLTSIGFEVLRHVPAAASVVFRRLNAPPSFAKGG